VKRLTWRLRKVLAAKAMAVSAMRLQAATRLQATFRGARLELPKRTSACETDQASSEASEHLEEDAGRARTTEPGPARRGCAPSGTCRRDFPSYAEEQLKEQATANNYTHLIHPSPRRPSRP
jgi:hypothetical protein